MHLNMDEKQIEIKYDRLRSLQCKRRLILKSSKARNPSLSDCSKSSFDFNHLEKTSQNSSFRTVYQKLVENGGLSALPVIPDYRISRLSEKREVCNFRNNIEKSSKTKRKLVSRSAPMLFTLIIILIMTNAVISKPIGHSSEPKQEFEDEYDYSYPNDKDARYVSQLADGDMQEVVGPDKLKEDELERVTHIMPTPRHKRNVDHQTNGTLFTIPFYNHYLSVGPNEKVVVDITGLKSCKYLFLFLIL